MESAKQFGEPNSLKIVKFYINYNDITHFKNRGIAPQRMKKCPYCAFSIKCPEMPLSNTSASASWAILLYRLEATRA